MKLAVGVVSNRDWRPSFGMSLVKLVTHLATAGINARGDKPVELEALDVLPRMAGSALVRGRRLLMQDAIDGGFTHLLSLDDDMIYPHDCLDYFCRSDEAMIAANYCSRNNAGKPVAVKPGDGGVPQHVMSKGFTGQEEVHRTGFGVALIDVTKVAAMPQPWFATPWIDDIKTELTEDYWFCVQLHKAGHKVIIDHDVSNNTLHMTDTALPTP
jgi:hypothetical protein